MNNMFYGMTNTEIFLIIGIIILLIVDFIIIPGMTLADKIDSIQMFCDACIFTIIWFFAMLLIFCIFLLINRYIISKMNIQSLKYILRTIVQRNKGESL